MKYKALVNVHHNNTQYPHGEKLDLSDQEARPLLEIGAIEPAYPPVKVQLNPLFTQGD
jgi:hypothetical protein